MSLSPPSEVTRLPRSLTKRKYWKGSEWHHWLQLFSIPALKGILGANFLHHYMLLHYMLLVEGVYLLSQDVVHLYDVRKADLCLNLFVSAGFSHLYGNENVSYTSSLGQSYQLGSTWCYSTYIFEGYMQNILKMFHGTQAVPLQIANRFHLFGNLIAISENMVRAEVVDDRLKDYLQE